MYRNQATYNKPLSDLYYKLFIKLEATRKLNLNLVTLEAYNIVTVYLDQADFEIQVPSAYQAKKQVLELKVYLSSELGLHKLNTAYNITIRAILNLLNQIRDLLIKLHTIESSITIQDLI